MSCLRCHTTYAHLCTLRHFLLLISAVLCTNPLGPIVSEQLRIHLEIVQNASVVQCSNLDDPLAGEGCALAPHGRTTISAVDVSKALS